MLKNSPIFNPPAEAAPSFRYIPRAIRPVVELLATKQGLTQMPRLFTEGFGPVKRLWAQSHNQRALRHLINTNMPVHFVSSFPRSGSTWTRHLLADVLLQVLGHQTDTDLPVPVAALVPDFYCDFIDETCAAERLVKTHDPFDQLRSRFGNRQSTSPNVQELSCGFIQNCRIVYLYRSPEDVLVSFYHFQRNAPYLRRSKLSIDDFCREETNSWIKHAESYLCASRRGAAVFFLSYETLLLNPVDALCDVLTWLKVDHTEEMVQTAVAHMHFEKMKAAAERQANDAREFLWRRGREGAGRIELQNDTLREIRQRTAPLLTRLTEVSNQQDSSTQAGDLGPTLLQRRIA